MESESKKKLLLLLVLVISFVLIILKFYDFPNNNLIINITLHSTMESIGAIIAIIFGLLLHNFKYHKTDLDFYWFSTALLIMGLLNFFHAISDVGNNFILYHSVSMFVGGLFSSLIIIQKFKLQQITKKYLLVIFVFLITTVSIILLILPEQGLLMTFEGEFTNSAMFFNISGGFLFFIPGIFFLINYYKKDIQYYYFYGVFFVLLGLSGIMFNDNLWSINWWSWHIILISAYSIGLLIVFMNYKKLSSDLLQNETKLKDQNKELLSVNSKLLGAKEVIEESEQRFRDFANSVTDIYFALDKDLNYTFWNNACENIIGYKSDDIVGKNWYTFDFNKGFEWIADKYKEIINTQKTESFECIFELSDNKMYCFIHAYPSTRGLVIYLQNITEIKRIELELINQNSEYEILNEKLIKAKEKAEESDHLKSEFINNMSHEIRTPMNGILGFSRFLNKENLSSNKRKQYINIIQSSGNQLMKIIDDILEISRLGTKQIRVIEKEVCLNDLFLEHFSIFDIKAKENKTPLYLKKGLSDYKSTILTDGIKLTKILSNLLENALKFTNSGFIEFGYQQKNTELEIYVKDTGIGIKTENQETIFNRFSQEEKEISKNVGGLGLGLSIAKENTELLGGQITVKSQKGEGTTFFVTIPYKPINKNPEDDNWDNDKEQNKHTILIVEDEEVNYLYIETLLEEEININCKTIHAKNGKEAVETCKRNSEIDLILMDLKMPIMNGYEATKLIKKIHPDLPIIAQSAYTTKDEKDQSFSAGCDNFISKPIDMENLNELLSKYLIKDSRVDLLDKSIEKN